VHTARTLPCTRGDTARTRPYTRHVTAPCTAVKTAVFGRVDGPYTALVHVDTSKRVGGRIRVVCTSRTWPCTRPMYGAVYAPCTRRKTSAQTARTQSCTRVVYTYNGRAVYTAHTRPCTGHVYGTAVIPPCTGRFRGRRLVHGPCTRPPCKGHTTRYTAVYTAVDGPYTDV